MASSSGRQAVFFIDVGWLRSRGNHLFPWLDLDSDFEVGRLITSASRWSKRPQQSELLRLYFYDGRFEDQPAAPFHQRVEKEDLCHIRFGHRLPSGGQKGVDTALVADLVRFGFTGVYQVAHIMTNDTDFAEPIRHLSDSGLQVVMYEFEDADEQNKLPDMLRSRADAVVAVPSLEAADLYGSRRFAFDGSTQPPWLLEHTRETLRNYGLVQSSRQRQDWEFVVKVYKQDERFKVDDRHDIGIRHNDADGLSVMIDGTPNHGIKKSDFDKLVSDWVEGKHGLTRLAELS